MSKNIAATTCVLVLIPFAVLFAAGAGPVLMNLPIAVLNSRDPPQNQLRVWLTNR
jgi:hypothetical protein